MHDGLMVLTGGPFLDFVNVKPDCSNAHAIRGQGNRSEFAPKDQSDNFRKCASSFPDDLLQAAQAAIIGVRSCRTQSAEKLTELDR